MRRLILAALFCVALANACGSAGSPARSTQGPGAPGAPANTATEEPKTYPQPTKSGPGYGY